MSSVYKENAIPIIVNKPSDYKHLQPLLALSNIVGDGLDLTARPLMLVHLHDNNIQDNCFNERHANNYSTLASDDSGQKSTSTQMNKLQTHIQ